MTLVAALSAQGRCRGPGQAFRESSYLAYTAGMSHRPQPSCSASSVPSVTGQGARSLSALNEATSSALLPLPPPPPLPLVLTVSAVCSLHVSGGHSRGEGLVAWAMTDSRLGRSTGAIPPPLPPPFLPPLAGAGAEAALLMDELEEVRRAALVWDAILPHLRCMMPLFHAP